MTEVNVNRYCPVCETNGKSTKLILRQINLTEAVYLCSDSTCLYPEGYSWILVNRNILKDDDSDSESSKSSSDNDFDDYSILTENSDVIEKLIDFDNLVNSPNKKCELESNVSNVLEKPDLFSTLSGSKDSELEMKFEEISQDYKIELTESVKDNNSNTKCDSSNVKLELHSDNSNNTEKFDKICSNLKANSVRRGLRSFTKITQRNNSDNKPIENISKDKEKINITNTTTYSLSVDKNSVKILCNSNAETSKLQEIIQNQTNVGGIDQNQVIKNDITEKVKIIQMKELPENKLLKRVKPNEGIRKAVANYFNQNELQTNNKPQNKKLSPNFKSAAKSKNIHLKSVYNSQSEIRCKILDPPKLYKLPKSVISDALKRSVNCNKSTEIIRGLNKKETINKAANTFEGFKFHSTVIKSANNSSTTLRNPSDINLSKNVKQSCKINEQKLSENDREIQNNVSVETETNKQTDIVETNDNQKLDDSLIIDDINDLLQNFSTIMEETGLNASDTNQEVDDWLTSLISS